MDFIFCDLRIDSFGITCSGLICRAGGAGVVNYLSDRT
jgi:hypothetical protein